MPQTLDVPGATLSYHRAGTGPLLLLIPGGAMDSEPFAEQGPAAATVAFLAVTGLDGGTPADPEHLPPDLVANFDVFYRWMFDAIGAYRAEVEVLRSRPVVVGVGETSEQGAERAARELARRLGQEPVSFAGDHVGFAADPGRFAAQLAPLLV